MRTSDVVRERALAFAEIGRDDDAAVRELVEAAMGKRVAVVMARQELEAADGDDAHSAPAASLLDRVLSTGTWLDVVAD